MKEQLQRLYDAYYDGEISNLDWMISTFQVATNRREMVETIIWMPERMWDEARAFINESIEEGDSSILALDDLHFIKRLMNFLHAR